MNKTLNICIIGGGIFGLTIALNLSKYCKSIKVFENNSEILNGATKLNHNRHHFGFHYPRSVETARQCLNGKKDFDKFYKHCIDYSFKNYYAISEKNSKVSFYDFEKFSNIMNLKFKEVETPDLIFNTSKISKCYLVNEGVYDFNKIKSVVIKRLSENKNIKIIKNLSVNSFVDISNTVTFKKNKKIIKEDFDIIINATYSNLNNHIYKIKNKVQMEYNLQEMCKLRIKGKRFGSTILDGEFPSILPIAGTNDEYLFAHVKFSQLVKKISKSIPKVILNKKYVSNLQQTFNESKKYLNILQKSKIIGNFKVIRSVNVDNQKDSRKSEIINYDNGNFSIFSGKIITVESLAKKIVKLVKMQY
tara:strand:- start:2395 stop:3477 length:1083 start_codon:yes stop_codon:yes gene_type:complete